MTISLYLDMGSELILTASYNIQLLLILFNNIVYTRSLYVGFCMHRACYIKSVLKTEDQNCMDLGGGVC
jgi:hypothetical protein